MKSIFDGINNAELIKELDPIEIADKWERLYKIDLGKKFRSIPKILYWRCNKSGYCWYEPSSAAGEGSLYSDLQRFEWYYLPEKWEFYETIRMLKSGEKVLEVGSGPGYFLQLALQKDCYPSGVELNPQAANILKKKGYTVYESSLKELGSPIPELFDVICSFQVLEHTPNPKNFIEDMLKLLRVGGRLILSVPNSAVMRKIDPFNEDLLNQPPHHMGHWDEGSFRALEGIFPIKMKSIRREPLANYHVCWVVNGYLRGLFPWMGRSIKRLLFNQYSTIPIQLILKAGLRKIVPGHTLLVEFEYLGQ